MDDPVQARLLVESIRSDLGIDEGGSLSKVATIAQNSLRMLSEELYSKPTRFLLELIQNADDSTYLAGISPQLSIVYRTDGFLWFGCNERGFSEANLRALCTVSESTKKVEGNRKGYIGEKGIGFKSVFKVADIVEISSGALQFKFDKNKPLGMVAPIWCDFNDNKLMNERTMFCFRIPEIAHRDIVRKDVSALEPELLLFLRQLRSISITIQRPDGLIEKSHHLRRTDDFGAGLRVTELLCSMDDGGDSTSERFVVCQHTAKGMPHHEKRIGVAESDLLVAFAVDENFEPQLRSRRVYNFLPIRGYGFPFVLQADFVLAASREDIQQDIPWNQALISAIRQLFIDSVDAFNKLGILKYSWPQYLKSQPKLEDSAFEGFFDSLRKHLRCCAVLRSETETLERPIDLQCARHEFTDGSSPLFPGSQGMRSFAHHGYHWEDLEALDVRQQSSEQFVSLLQDYVKRSPTEFRKQRAEWHSRLAAAVNTIGAHAVRGLNIIALRNNKWTSCKAKKLFFPNLGEGITIPKGIEVDVVDDEAAEDENRRALYLSLGVCTLDEAKVFDLILQQHGRQGQSKASWAVEDVVEHAWFLFRAKSYPREFDLNRLLVASRDDNLFSGKDVYMDAPDSRFPLSKFLDKTSANVHYLHDEYYDFPSSQTVDDPRGPETLRMKWLNWLHEAIGVRTVPRLVGAGGVSPEFATIVKAGEENEWLQLLKDEWDAYALDLQSPANEKVKASLTEITVLCLDGEQRALKDVYLPTREVLSEPLAKNNIPMLKVKDPGDEDWRKLGRSLHMRISIDAHMFITILTRMKEGYCNFGLEDVKRMYTGLARCFNRQAGLDFRNKSLVYIATPRPGKWVSLFSCRWSSPPSIITLFALDERYKGNAELFRHKLQLGDASAQDVVSELAKLNGEIGRVDAIKELLKVLASFVAEGKIDINSFPRLTDNRVKVLPVRKGEEVALQAFFGDDWFIAPTNMEHLVNAFEGLVFFLDLDLPSESPIRKLFAHLGCLVRLLDEQVQRHLVFPEEGHLLEQETRVLRSKAEYLARIAEVPRREEALNTMLQSQVSVSDVIIKRSYVTVKGRRVYGSDQTSPVALQTHSSSLQIWLNAANYGRDRMPTAKFSEALCGALGIPLRNRTLVELIFEDDDRVRIEQDLEEGGYGRPFVPQTPAIAAPPVNSRSHARVYNLNTNGRNAAGLTRGNASYGAFSNGSTAPRTSRPYVQTNGYSSHRQPPMNGSSGPLYGVASIRAQSGRRNGPGRARAPSCSRDDGSSAYQGTGSNINTSRLNLGKMRSTLQRAFAEEEATGFAALIDQAAMSNETAATKSELAIGCAGEQYVYELLKAEIGIGDECWTSAARTGYGLDPFDADEAEYSDFTITDPVVSARLAAWLLQKAEVAVASEWLDTPKTFHIEVKTTNGRHDERWEMSNNQARLAKQWHFSPHDELIIFRVYHIGSTPDFNVYVDPSQLKKENVLGFEPKMGYYVWPI